MSFLKGLWLCQRCGWSVELLAGDVSAAPQVAWLFQHLFFGSFCGHQISYRTVSLFWMRRLDMIITLLRSLLTQLMAFSDRVGSWVEWRCRMIGNTYVFFQGFPCKLDSFPCETSTHRLTTLAKAYKHHAWLYGGGWVHDLWLATNKQ